MNRLNVAWALAGLLLAAGCEGKLTGGTGGDPADGPPGGASDGPPVVAGAYRLSGNVTDYDDGSPLMAMALETQGISPQLTTTSDAAGAYAFEAVPTGSALFVRAVPGGPGYRGTFSAAIVVQDADVVQDINVVSEAYVARQLASAGILAVANTSIVVGDLWKPDGTPLLGAPLTDVSLVNAAGLPQGSGPYFLGPTGDVSLAITVSAADLSGRARVAWLNVPTGSHTIKLAARGGPPVADGIPADAAIIIPDAAVIIADAAVVVADAAVVVADAAVVVADGGGGGGGGGGTPTEVPVVCTDNGATLASVQSVGGGGGGGGGGEVPANPLFTTDVFPILQRASAGGVGCAGCHTSGGLAGNLLILDDGAGPVHARLIANPAYVNLAVPADSLILRKPLFETPPNHPNAIFLTTSDPGYRTILNWISTGAPL